MSNEAACYRRPWFLAMVAVLLVLIAVAAGMFWFSNPGEEPRPARQRASKPMAPEVVVKELDPKEDASAEEDMVAPAVAVVEETPGPAGVLGTVLWSDGTPTAEAEVVVKRIPKPNESTAGAGELLGAGTTDVEGAFFVSGLPYAWMSVEAQHGQACAFTLIMPTQATPVSQVDLMLEEGGLLAGVVVNRDGAPVSDALLRGHARSDGQEESPYVPQGIRTHTDETGKFRFDLLPKEAWRFRVDAPGYAAAITDLFPTGSEGNRIVLEREGKVVGLARLRPRGQPAARVALRAALCGELKLVFDAETAEDGRFEFAGLSTGSYELKSRDNRYCAEPCKVSVTTGQTSAKVELWLAKAGIIKGRVYDVNTGAGFRGVRVAANAPDANTSAGEDTGTDGSYALGGLAPGTYRLSLSGDKQGFREFMPIPPVTLPAGAEMQVDIPVDGGTFIAGIVVDAGGRPVANAMVLAECRGTQTWGNSDEAGMFRLSGLAAGMVAEIHASCGVWENHPIEAVTVPAEGLRDLRIVLDRKRNASIAGTVTDAAGRALAARVSAFREGSRGGPGTSAKDNGNGRFQFARLSPGTYALSVWFQNRNRILATIALHDGEHLTDVRLVFDLDEGLSISGHVLDSSHRPVAGANVTTAVSIDERTSKGISAVTDAEGAYVLADLPAGEYTVGADHPKFYAEQARYEVAAGSEGVDFVLYAKPRVAGQVLDRRTNRPVSAYTLGVSRGQQTISDAEGRFEWFGLPRAYEFTIVAPGYATYSLSLDLSSGQSVDGLSIALERSAAAVEGVVTDADGVPVAGAHIHQGATVVFDDPNRGPVLAVTDPDGRFAIETAADRLTVVSALHPNYAPAAGALEGEPDGVRTIALIMSPAAAIESRVTLDGRPYAGAAVDVEKDDGITSTGGRTDDEGGYTIAGIPPGAYDVACELLSDDPAIRAIPEQHKKIQVGAGETVTADFEFHSRQ